MNDTELTMSQKEHSIIQYGVVRLRLYVCVYGCEEHFVRYSSPLGVCVWRAKRCRSFHGMRFEAKSTQWLLRWVTLHKWVSSQLWLRHLCEIAHSPHEKDVCMRRKQSTICTCLGWPTKTNDGQQMYITCVRNNISLRWVKVSSTKSSHGPFVASACCCCCCCGLSLPYAHTVAFNLLTVCWLPLSYDILSCGELHWIHCGNGRWYLFLCWRISCD